LHHICELYITLHSARRLEGIERDGKSPLCLIYEREGGDKMGNIIGQIGFDEGLVGGYYGKMKPSQFFDKVFERLQSYFA
jgi:hypothetical protein